MFTEMSILWLLILSSNVVVQAQTGSMYTSPNMPSFYRGEQGTFTCQLQTNDQLPFDNVTGFGLKRTPLDGSDDVYSQCSIEVVFGQPKKATAATNSRVSDQACEDAYQDLSENGVATLQVNWDMQETGSYQCLVFSGSQASVSDAVTRVEQLLVAPTYHQTDVPSGVYAGKAVQFFCQAEGGDPPANWQYAIGGEVIGPEPGRTAVVSPEDNGKLFTCLDLNHPNYNGAMKGESYNERRLEVYYMESKEETIETAPFTNTTLKCHINGNIPNGTSFSYSWTKNGKLQAEKSKNMQVITDCDDRYVCVATASDVNLQGPAMVTYKVNSHCPKSATTNERPTYITWVFIAAGIWIKIYV